MQRVQNAEVNHGSDGSTEAQARRRHVGGGIFLPYHLARRFSLSQGITPQRQLSFKFGVSVVLGCQPAQLTVELATIASVLLVNLEAYIRVAEPRMPCWSVPKLNPIAFPIPN